MSRLLSNTHLSLAVATLLALADVGLARGGSVAVYEVRFDATWSGQTHPGAYPAGAHFSPLIGGTHDATVHFWEDGGLATNGIEVMAETGSPTPLRNEILAVIGAGDAGEVIEGDGISSPGDTSTTFTATAEFSRVTLVTMVAPSPDWFIGTESLELRPGGQWLGEVVVDLFAWDAGTDSGANFNSPNQDTNPQDPIALITGGPFFGVTPLGTFTFTRVAASVPTLPTWGLGALVVLFAAAGVRLVGRRCSARA